MLDDQRPSLGITTDATLASVSTSAGAPDDTTRPPLSSTQWSTRQPTSKSWVPATIVLPGKGLVQQDSMALQVAEPAVRELVEARSAQQPEPAPAAHRHRLGDGDRKRSSGGIPTVPAGFGDIPNTLARLRAGNVVGRFVAHSGLPISLSLEPGMTGATSFLKLVSFLRRNIAIRS
jgi:hypothetical protein